MPLVYLPLVVVSFVAARKASRRPVAAGAAAFPSLIFQVGASLVSAELWESSVFFVAGLVGADVYALCLGFEGEGAGGACWDSDSCRVF